MGSIVLLSGGYDSALIAYRNPGTRALWIDYGQQSAAQEHQQACALQRQLGFEMETVSLQLRINADRVACPVVPARNAVLLSIAANYTEPGDTILIGCNAADQELFADCRLEFLEVMGCVLDRKIKAPLLSSSKAEIVRECDRAGLLCWTCYLPVNGEPCGHCVACRTLEDAR
jgi:7-cyano-7-deazaguanine synthase